MRSGAKQPRAAGFDCGQGEKGEAHQSGRAADILTGSMRVHKAMLPHLTFQIENLINLDQLPSRLKIIALPAKWHSESAPARVIALVD